MNIVEFVEKHLDVELLDCQKKFLIELANREKPIYVSIPKGRINYDVYRHLRNMMMSIYGNPKGDDINGQKT